MIAQHGERPPMNLSSSRKDSAERRTPLHAANAGLAAAAHATWSHAASNACSERGTTQTPYAFFMPTRHTTDTVEEQAQAPALAGRAGAALAWPTAARVWGFCPAKHCAQGNCR